MTEPRIEARDLSRRFGDTKALEGLNLRVGRGEMVALLGPDGAGKTTAMRLMAGVIRPDSGTVRLAGIDLGTDTEAARARLGYVPQRFSLYGELTVLENLRFLAEVRGLTGGAWIPRAEAMLAFVGMEPFRDRRVSALSGGMRQKLGLAAALIHRPEVLLLDEPTSGVDPIARQAFWRLLVQLLREETGILISTPYMDEAARCTRVGFLHQGRLLVDATPAELRRPLEGRILEIAVPHPETWGTRLEQVVGVEETLVFGGRLRARVAPGAAAETADRVREWLTAERIDDAEVRVVGPSLDDVFRLLLRTDAPRDTE